MTDELCKYGHSPVENEDKDATDKWYCRRCNMVLIAIPTWIGNVRVGKLESRFEADGISFRMKDQIEMYLGTSIEISDIVVDNSQWYRYDYMIGFYIGKSLMTAHLTDVSSSRRYEETGIFHKEVEAETEEVATN